jgi:hypothetical protein
VEFVCREINKPRMLLRKVFYLGVVVSELGRLAPSTLFNAKTSPFLAFKSLSLNKNCKISHQCRTRETRMHIKCTVVWNCLSLSYTPIFQTHSLPSPSCILHSSAYNIIADPQYQAQGKPSCFDMENAAVKQAPNYPPPSHSHS